VRRGRFRTFDSSPGWPLVLLASVLIAVAWFGRRYLLPRRPRPHYAPSPAELLLMSGVCYVPIEPDLDT